MKPSDLEKLASDESIIGLAESIRANLSKSFSDVIKPIFEKFAEEAKENKEAKEEPPVMEEEVVTPTPTTQNINRSADLQGKTDELMQVDKPTIDKKELEAAITEAIATMNVQGLGKIILSLKESVGEETASNAISIAKQVMQDLLVSGQLDKEQVSGLAQAFAAAEE